MRKFIYVLLFRGLELRAWIFALLSCGCILARADVLLPQVAAVNVTDIIGNLRGGMKPGARLLDKAEITASYGIGDPDAYSAFADLQITNGGDFTQKLAGNIQGASSIEAPAGLHLADAWMARDFSGQAGVKAGIIDLNTEFDVQATAALFLNSAFGIGPDFSQSGDNGPSIFPDTGLGLVGWWLPGAHWQLKGGLFEGTPGDPAHPGSIHLSLSRDEGALTVLEARNHLTPDFVVGLGTWRYTKSFDAIDPAMGRLSGNSGLYAIGDGQLYDAPEGENAGLAGWIRLGFADARVNSVRMAVSGGLVYTAPFGRMADQAGIAFARVQIGKPARLLALARPAETTLETTYSLTINSHLTLQPDLQYVISPDGASSDAVILASRITASW